MSYGAYLNQKLAKRDLVTIKRHRRRWADRRRKPPTEADIARHRWFMKRLQFDMALHRRGLTSPYDYEYPRLKQMNKLAKELHARHIDPLWEKVVSFRGD